jgi:hypothetical protein
LLGGTSECVLVTGYGVSGWRETKPRGEVSFDALVRGWPCCSLLGSATSEMRSGDGVRRVGLARKQRSRV